MTGTGPAPTETAGLDETAKPEFDWDVFRRALPEKHSFPMNQQDVDEIFHKIFGLFQAAIGPSGVDPDPESGGQIDDIVSNFYFKTKVVLKTLDENGSAKTTTVQRPAHRNLTAYPDKTKALSIYEALDPFGFDPESLVSAKGEPQTRLYSFLEPTPPFLHVLIQRTDNAGQKNSGIVQIPEQLYLDRYMDAPEDSLHYKLREKYWHAKDLEAQLVEAKKALESDKVTAPIKPLGDMPIVGEFEQDSQFRVRAAEMLEQALRSSQPADQGEGLIRQLFFEDDESTLPSQASSEVRGPPASRVDRALETEMAVDGPTDEAADVSEEAQAHLLQDVISHVGAAVLGARKIRDALWADSKNHGYTLHAIICHSGTGAGGHYWVWIRDFETGIWRKYNDEITTETRSDTNALLNELNSKDFPYFVAYVRDNDKMKLVGAPRREPVSIEA
jgi:ubiquitin carboxyl-terminal hydrolase 25